MSERRIANGESDPLRGAIVGVLRRRAQIEPERIVYTFVGPGKDSMDITFRELDERAGGVANHIRHLAHQGQPVLLAYPPGHDQIVAFFGCLYAGLIPVPTALPNVGRDRIRADAIIREARPALVLTTTERFESARNLFETEGGGGTPCLTTDNIQAERMEERDLARPMEDDVAYLQYTSGSTSAPKGVVITHRCLTHNLLNIERGFQHSADDISVNWLPHFHDMGLVYGFLQPVFSGFRSIQLSASTFVRRPIEWLRAISRWRATHSGGPNFAYELCVWGTTEQDRSELDLGSWKVAFCGAEPIRHSSMTGFQQAYEPYGFGQDVFCPAYGLAEATLKVSGGEAGAAPKTLRTGSESFRSTDGAVPPSEKTLVSCGRAGLDTSIRIVDPITLNERAEGSLGEIWVSGPGVAAGYWNRPEETAWTFRAVLPASPEREHLRTGDLGFLQGEDLFVVGRLKDVIIARGQNFFAEDIELIVKQSCPNMEGGAVAAFSVEVNEEERPVVALERPRSTALDPTEIILAVRRSVGEQLGLLLHAVVIVAPRQIPRTSSGKVMRGACRNAYLDGSLRVIQSDVIAPTRNLADALADARQSIFDDRLNAQVVRHRLEKIISALTGTILSDENWESPLSGLGIDSLKSAELERCIYADFGVSLDPVSILSGLTPGAALRHILQTGRLVSIEAGDGCGAGAFSDDGVVRTSPSIEQERLWIAENTVPKGSLNLGGVKRFHGRLEVSAMREAIARVFIKHVSLRLSFQFKSGGLRLFTENISDTALPVSDLRAFPPDQRALQARELLEEEWKFHFDPARAPLIRFRLLVVDDAEFLLSICAHHLICDYRSLQILASELGDAYVELLEGRQSPPPDLIFDYRRFAEWQREEAGRNAWESSLNFWRRHLDGYNHSPSNGYSVEKFPRKYARSQAALDAEMTRALREHAAKHGATPFMALIAAFAGWLRQSGGPEDLVIACPVSGRWEPGAEQAVGLFAYPIPVRIDLSGDLDFYKLLRRVRSSFLAAYRHQRVPFSKILDAVTRNGVSSRALTRLMCNMISAEERAGAASHPPEPFEIQQGTTDFDLNVTWIEDGDILGVEVAGDSSFLAQEDGAGAARRLVDYVGACLTRPEDIIVESPETPVEEPEPSRPKLMISSTFTGGGLRESLNFWISKLSLGCELEFLPDGQVFQALLDPAGPLRRNRIGMNALLLRLHDWRPPNWRAGGPPPQNVRDDFRKTVADFIEFLRASALSSPAAFLVCVCPDPVEALADPEWSREYIEAETSIASIAEGAPNIRVITSRDLLDLYPVEDYADQYTEAIAGAPYTPAFYAGIGAAVIRKYAALITPRPKVIALDCDNTLWKGVCGEDSVSQIVVDSAAMSVQKAALALREAGVLLVLCSKNDMADVWNVFTGVQGMLLRREHLTAWRINWNSKSANLREISKELGFDLGTVVFLDDNPVECAEVRANCPEISVFELPADRSEVSGFLKHLWPLDVGGATADDRRRAESYQIEALRREAEKAAPSLGDFIAELRLECAITPVLSQHVDRVAQLMVRTTQMNTNPSRCAPMEAQSLIHNAGHQWRAVHVSDRFGDYGLVGAFSCKVTPPALEVETFLLSCRALGRGIESRMIRELGVEAEKAGATEIRFTVVSTNRNEPARLLLASLGGVWRSMPVGQSLTIQTSQAFQSVFDPDKGLRTGGHLEKTDNAAPLSADKLAGPTVQVAIWEEVATRLNTPERILNAIRAPRKTAPNLIEPATSSSPIEREIASRCASLLKVEAIGLDTDFFSAGGDSLLAVELLGWLQRVFDIEIPLANIFGGELTARGLARQVELAVLDNAECAEMQQALDGLKSPLSAQNVREPGGFGG